MGCQGVMPVIHYFRISTAGLGSMCSCVQFGRVSSLGVLRRFCTFGLFEPQSVARSTSFCRNSHQVQSLLRHPRLRMLSKQITVRRSHCPSSRSLSPADDNRDRILERLETLPLINLATLGDCGHGKSTLVSALTFVLHRDRSSIPGPVFLPPSSLNCHPNEREKGKHVLYVTQQRKYIQIDCPGSYSLYKAVIMAALSVDAAILVVSPPNGGPQPQTYEHVQYARQAGIKHLLVFLSKADLMGSFGVERAASEMKEVLEQHGYDPAKIPIIAGSAQLALEEKEESEIGAGSIRRLIHALDETVPAIEKDIASPFVMPIVSAMACSEVPASIVIGNVSRGTIRVGESVQVISERGVELECLASEIQAFNQPMRKGTCGNRIGIRLSDQMRVGKGSGRFLVSPEVGTSVLSNHFSATLHFLSPDQEGSARPIVREQCLVFMNSTLSRIVRIDHEREFVMPGETVQVGLTFAQFTVLIPGQKCFLLENKKVVARGVIDTPLEHAYVPLKKLTLAIVPPIL